MVYPNLDLKSHWDGIFANRPSDQHGWYQPHLRLSLQLIEGLGLARDASIIDVGGGDSSLVDDLIDLGYARLTVLDVSGAALRRSRARLAGRESRVAWIEGDMTQLDLPAGGFQVWHDRAAFHFLNDPLERGLYVLALRRSLAPGGFALIATFAPDGPHSCSGLPVTRYSPETLGRELGPHFVLRMSFPESHRTPGGGEQSFQYSLFQHLEA